MTIAVLPIYKYTKEPNDVVVSTVAKSYMWRELSPFVLGPCKLYKKHISMNMENAWQYAKVYEEHLVDYWKPNSKYFQWAKEGWKKTVAVRYPMGKGAIPEFSFWNGERLDYIDARKQIYVPLYAEAVQQTLTWRRLEDTYHDCVVEKKRLVLLDYDAYDHRQWNFTLTQVLNNAGKKMGHAFVLMMLLKGDKALKECNLR